MEYYLLIDVDMFPIFISGLLVSDGTRSRLHLNQVVVADARLSHLMMTSKQDRRVLA